MKKMTIMQHFAELRRRILWVVAFFVAAFVGGWFVAPFVQGFLTAPLLGVWRDAQLLYTGITDGLMIQLSIAFLVAIMITTPFALYQVWRYVAPGLHKNEKKFVVSIFVFSPLLFVAGVAFAFYLLFPFVFRFFIELNESAPVPAVIMPAVRDYIGFAIGLLKVFGIAFQLPLVLVLLNRAGALPRERVIAMRRYAIIFIVIAAAVLTPPDIVSQILLAVPMLALFELSILFMKK
ncbi:MAG: twin-arginine translocase subunit TatC [Alphaproteobacteria bacterium]|nr:twin-arginine translocase subunit TatC [Alphaproteobacteria bacterium]MBQ7127731.1 twin-arginine translocase subunit TatC [Alphaproteobacteria bacterium]